MKRKMIYIALLMLLVGYAVPALATAPRFQGDSISGSYGDPNDLYLSYTVSGADFSQDTNGDPHLVGRYTGATIQFSGEMIVTRAEGFLSYVSMSASLGDQSVQWPKEGEDNAVSGKTVQVPFNFTFQVPPDYEHSTVTGSAFVQACGGVCGTFSIDLVVEMPTLTPTPTPSPQPNPPCEGPMFLYPGIDLNEHFTGQPALRYSDQEMSDDLTSGLRRFIDEGNAISAGDRLSDPYFVAKSYINSAMATGQEASLQEAARQMARERQKSDPDYRLSPGDLFYLSLKRNNGNVRDALLTCHAALYRDGKGVNKKFVEQENILAPLRNPAGYADRETTYTSPRGSERTINPLKELGQENQGPWYHFFGLTALEFTNSYGAASFHAAWLALEWGDLPANYTDLVLSPDFPTHKLNNSLGDLSIALEHNVRANMAKPPDIAKYCINYYALTAGRALKSAVFAELGKPSPDVYSDRFGHFDNPGNILTSEGTILYKSPLSIYIQGVDGEWFSFDQISGVVDGNTPLVYFEILPKEDGTSSFLGAPFFEMASIQMTGAGEGPVTLGLYDRDSERSSVFEFDVQAGDQILVEDWAEAPLLNSVPLEKNDETTGIFATGLGSGNGWIIWLFVGCGGLFALALIGVFVVLLVRSRRPATRPVTPARPSTTTDGRGPTWQLAVQSGPNAGQRYTLGPQTRLGRDPNSDVRLDDSQVSRHHALFQRQGDGCVLSDLNSSNGIFVNGVRVGQPTWLQAGDVIQIGRITLKILGS